MKRYNIINNSLGWLCFLIAAVTYLLTIEPTASFWDCPEFILQAFKLEVGHPPGNPIFMLAGRFFITLFGGDLSSAAVAVNSMSALLSAATILLLFWTITHLIKRLVVKDDATEVTLSQMLIIMGGGLCGALAYTWSDTFWFSAVEGEVYAFSSFCTALVFWLILKWEARADQPHSDRYLVLIAYVIGVSIAVHLLNLLCIPALGLVYYYRKFKNVNAVGSLIALGVSCVIVGLILYGLVPGFINVAQWFELFFVNTLGFGYNVGVAVYAAVALLVFILAARSLYLQRSASSIKWLFFASIILSGMPFIGDSWVIPTVFILGLAVYLFMFCPKVPVRIFNVIVLSILVIFIGYSSYALLLIRASANPPMNQNAPDNVFALASYLNREQYGDRPLFYGPVFTEEPAYQDINGSYFVKVNEQGIPETRIMDGYLRDGEGRAYNEPTRTYTKIVKTREGQPDQYVEEVERPHYKSAPDVSMLFTRIYSTADGHPQAYKSWADYVTPDIYELPMDLRRKWAEQKFAPLTEIAPYLTHQQVITTAMTPDGTPVNHISAWKPGFGVNLRYFLNYQLNHMYWRYFMWNFAGRQNDLQGNGEPHLGNWISGIPFIDNARLGDQSLLPDEFSTGNKGHNVFYMLPLLLGVIGLLWQALYNHPSDPRRGIEQFWVVFFLFFMTGIAIVLYLNQTPGQPRERDYAFAGSFYAFAIWIGIGVPAIGSMIAALFKKPKKSSEEGESADTAAMPFAAVLPAVAIGLFVPLQMVSQTWDDHDRSGRYTTRDFGMNYLASLDDNAIIFTNGDNDTFPLWYAQEVEGFRTDVRVVNLSYLTTDWYAHNLTYPYYEAAPVKMYATPKDYAYERLAYSFVIPMADTLTTAEAALRSLYASDAKRYGAPVMTSPRIVIPTDSAAAMKHFGITDSIEAANLMPSFGNITLNLAEQGQGASQSKVLSLDIIANAITDGWQRPVYVASTVPKNYYLGLDPYMYSTGMALEITPFRDAPYSPNADRAYENFMSKFRWGGLDTAEDPSSLYLDETVRRMVSSTRSAMIECADNLMTDGERPATQWAVDFAKANGQPVPQDHYDMARNLLNLMQEKMPAEAALYDGLQTYYIAGDYLTLYDATGNPDDLAKAEAVLDNEIPRLAQLINYAGTLSRGQLNSLGASETIAIQYLGLLTGLKNAVALFRAIEGREDREELLQSFAPGLGMSYAQTIYPMIYLDDYTIDELRTGRDHTSGVAARLYDNAIRLLELHKAAGVEPMAITDSIVAANGIDINTWRRLVD